MACKESERLGIDSMSIKGTFYHGTSVRDMMYILSRDYSDYGAVWIARDEHIAEQFADYRHCEDEIKCVYRVRIKDMDNIAIIEYGPHIDIMEHFCCSDIQEIIPFLINMGYNGWWTPGSIGRSLYDDYAIFSDILIEDVKMFINGEWTEYINIDDAGQIILNNSPDGELLLFGP